MLNTMTDIELKVLSAVVIHSNYDRYQFPFLNHVYGISKPSTYTNISVLIGVRRPSFDPVLSQVDT